MRGEIIIPKNVNENKILLQANGAGVKGGGILRFQKKQ